MMTMTRDALRILLLNACILGCGCSLQDFDKFSEPVLPDGSDGTVTLTVRVEGDGNGTVREVGSADWDCSSVCNIHYPWGTTVVLEGSAWGGSEFSGWTEPCTGTSTCTVSLDEDTVVSADFVLVP